MQSHFLAVIYDKENVMLPAFVRGTGDSYRRQVYSCWKYWQQQLAPEEVRQLLQLLDQANVGGF